MSEEPLIHDDEKIDCILDGKLRIIQRQRGYRFSIDALLLASFVTLKDKDRVIELGTGSGIISVIMAQHSNLARILGVEIQEGLFSIALRNISLNSLGDRVEVIRGDVRKPASCCGPQSFSLAVFNPPYRRIHSGRINPDSEKAAARHEIFGTAGDFVEAAAWALQTGGRMSAIYPSTRMAELISKMRSARIEPKKLRPVYSRQGTSAVFVLVEGVKEGGEELEIMPPLVIYDARGEYTDEMREIFRHVSSSEFPGGG
jgi:tRNA1Val (adenine37-N6)-methyltransferase